MDVEGVDAWSDYESSEAYSTLGMSQVQQQPQQHCQEQLEQHSGATSEGSFEISDYVRDFDPFRAADP